MVKKRVLSFGLLLYFAISVWIFFFFPYSHASRLNPDVDRIINLIPLATHIHYFEKAYCDGHKNYIKEFWLNIGGNVLIFVPAGGFLVFYIRTLRKAPLIIILIFLSSSIEVLQIISKRGSFDVDDIILNTIGGIAGYQLVKLLLELK